MRISYFIISCCLLVLLACSTRVNQGPLSIEEDKLPDSYQEPVVVPSGLSLYFVAPDGNDSNPGTLERPWATWQKAFTAAEPGDTVYIRGGVYYAGNEDEFGVFVAQKKGSKTYPFSIFNYPGETPILDCSRITSTKNNIGIKLQYCSWFHLKGLTVTGVSQHGRSLNTAGFALDKGVNHKLEQCISHGNEGPGFHGYNVDTVYLINCDAYDNYDVSTEGYPGGQADGFVFCFTSSQSYTYYEGCRSWFNSDDGFDCWENEGVVVFKECWAFKNGRGGGDGGGFKLGQTIQPPLSVSQRILTHCLAFDNRFIGFNQNDGNVRMTFYNNTAYSNDRIGFDVVQYKNPIILRNNVSYRNGSVGNFTPYGINDHNSWNDSPDVSVSINDFLDVNADHEALSGKRGANGALPSINFLKLATGSDLIDKGVDVGLPFNGKAPDLGAYEK